MQCTLARVQFHNKREKRASKLMFLYHLLNLCRVMHTLGKPIITAALVWWCYDIVIDLLAFKCVTPYIQCRVLGRSMLSYLLGGVHRMNSRAGASSLSIPLPHVYCVSGHSTPIQEGAQVGVQTTNALGTNYCQIALFLWSMLLTSAHVT